MIGESHIEWYFKKIGIFALSLKKDHQLQRHNQVITLMQELQGVPQPLIDIIVELVDTRVSGTEFYDLLDEMMRKDQDIMKLIEDQINV